MECEGVGVIVVDDSGGCGEVRQRVEEDLVCPCSDS